MIDTNLSGTFKCIRAVLPTMVGQTYGRIIVTSSGAGRAGAPNLAHYASTKWGIIGLTKTVALETAQFGITVNAICPGYVWTPLVEKQIPDTMAARGLTREQVIKDVLLSAQPTKEFVTVEEIAGLALYLTSDLARSITGAILAIDGGWTAA